MAISLTEIANTILTSIHGRRLGLDPNGYLAGPPGLKRAITAATSDTTGTALPNHGVVTVTTSTNNGWSLTDPVEGAEVTVACGSGASTGVHTVTPAAATIVSTNGVAGSAFTLTGYGAAITLCGLSTAVWLVQSRNGSTVSVNVSS